MAATSLPVSTVETNPRVERALALHRSYGHLIEEVAPDFYLVPGQSGEHFWHVDYAEETCDCPDHQYRRVTCIHIFAVGIHKAKRRSRPHACKGGLVYMGRLDEETGDQIVEAVPCKRCQ